MFSRQKRDDAFVRDKTIQNEGGGLDAKALAALDAGFDKNKKGGLNYSSDGGDSHGFSSENSCKKMNRELAKEYATSDVGTVIEGLPEFDKYGRLFQDLTTRAHIDTLN